MLGRESSFPSGLEGKIVFLCGGFGRVGDEEVWEDREGTIADFSGRVSWTGLRIFAGER